MSVPGKRNQSVVWEPLLVCLHSSLSDPLRSSAAVLRAQRDRDPRKPKGTKEGGDIGGRIARIQNTTYMLSF